MTLWLDTHTFLWWLSDPANLSVDARVAIEDPANQVLVSTVVLWEIAIKRTIGKLSTLVNLEAAVPGVGFIRLPISVPHISATETLPLHHRDPFDRMLAAQAQVENATLVTRDPSLFSYSVSIIKA